MATVTISKKEVEKGDGMIVLSMKQYWKLLEGVQANVTEKQILGWSREAKKLKRAGKLPMLRSLREL